MSTGRVAVVAGASSGIGAATAKRLAAAGAKVAVLARRADWLEGTKKEMTWLAPEDVAETILFLASRPAHVNLQPVTIMPTRQPS